MLSGSQRDAPTGRDELRRIRVSAIFSTLLEAGPLARTDLAHRTGYSPSTVTGIVQDLSDAGYLRVVGQQESTGGRRRTLIELNRSAVTIAVVGLRGTRIWCALVDLEGNRLDAAEQDFDPADPVGSTRRDCDVLHRRAEIPPVTWWWRCPASSPPTVRSRWPRPSAQLPTSASRTNSKPQPGSGPRWKMTSTSSPWGSGWTAQATASTTWC